MVKRIEIDGSPIIGVFALCTEDVIVVPPNVTGESVTNLERELGVSSLKIQIGASSVIGSLVAGNSSGFLVTSSASKGEIKLLREINGNLKVRKLPGRINAAGNVILANDTAALIHPHLISRAKEVVEETLGVDVRRGTIAGLKTVGMVARATNKGVLVHPKTSEDELSELDGLFNVTVEVGTVNYGSPFVGSALLANTKGYVAGRDTTGIELGRIEEAFGFIKS